MAVGDDFKVSRRYREDVSDIAAKWRLTDPQSGAQNRFNVVRLLEDFVLPTLARQDRKVRVKLVEDDWVEPEAQVDVSSGEMSVQRWVWQSALKEEEHARLVIAHEIGHLILHGEQVHAFSRGLEKKLKFLEPTDSAEAQANWFASSLLLPDAVLLRLFPLDNYSIATLTLTTEHLVSVRRRELQLDKRYRNYSGDQCPRCLNFTVSMHGTCYFCETCQLQIASV